MVEACALRILEFPLDMDAREVAKEPYQPSRFSFSGFVPSAPAQTMLRMTRILTAALYSPNDSAMQTVLA